VLAPTDVFWTLTGLFTQTAPAVVKLAVTWEEAGAARRIRTVKVFQGFMRSIILKKARKINLRRASPSATPSQ
jgi:hypothetical protein